MDWSFSRLALHLSGSATPSNQDVPMAEAPISETFRPINSFHGKGLRRRGLGCDLLSRTVCLQRRSARSLG